MKKEKNITEESELKSLIVEFVGNRKNPEKDEVTVEHIIEVFSEEFPEFIIKIAEENWINGYTQALNDVEFMEKNIRNTNRDQEEKNQCL